MSDSTELVVIGGGPGGYAAAFLAADLGIQTVLVESRENPGGVCLYEGCIPSKALLHAAHVIHGAAHAEKFGIRFGTPEIDLNKLRAWKDSVVKQLTGGIGQLAKTRKVRHIRGHARFANSTTLNIELHGSDGKSAGSQELRFRNAIIATGSLPIRIPGLPESERIMDSTGALELTDIPKRLLVVGGGYIGLEMSTVYAGLGSKVTVVEMTDSLLSGTDPDLVGPLEKSLRERLENIYLSTKLSSLETNGSSLKARFEGPNLDQPEQTFDRVLLSLGRRPALRNIGLENTAVKLREDGFVDVNEQLRTSEPNIYAIGDVAGQPMLAHKASHEGRTAVEAIAGHKVAFEPNAIPAVVFTDPEIAYCGLTENKAKANGREIAVARFPWAASGRALTLGGAAGMTKLIFDKDTERLLGAGIVGPGAGELISEMVLALEMGALAKDVALTIHPHPTLSETVMEASEVFLGTSTHVYRPKK